MIENHSMENTTSQKTKLKKKKIRVIFYVILNVYYLYKGQCATL